MIAICQLCSTNDVDSNFSACELLVKKAKKFGTQLVCLPECFAFVGENNGDAFRVADFVEDNLLPIQNLEDAPASLFQRYRRLAIQHDIWLSLGGFPEKIRNEGQNESSSAPSERIFNSHILVDNLGKIRAIYRKLHLFKVDIKGGPSLNESLTFSAGNEKVVVDSPVGKLGLTTCYDVRFPELYVSLRKMGADVILVPSAFTLMTGKDHWEVLLRARAIETQCYVVAAAQYGAHNPKRSSYGHALACDPWGTVVSCCPDSAPSLVLVEIDHDRVAKVRQSMPVFEHRREDVY